MDRGQPGLGAAPQSIAQLAKPARRLSGRTCSRACFPQVLPLVHVSALLFGRAEYSLWCRKSKGVSEFRRPAPSSTQHPGENRPG
jgi:hypothetical protein